MATTDEQTNPTATPQATTTTTATTPSNPNPYTRANFEKEDVYNTFYNTLSPEDQKSVWGSKDKIYQKYVDQGSSWMSDADKASRAASSYTDGGDVTARNVQDYASGAVNDPTKIINGENGTSAVDATKNQTGTAAQIDPNTGGLGTTPTVTPQTVDKVTPTEANGYDTTKTTGQVANNQVQAAQGTVSDGAIISPDEVPQADTTGIATGVNKDGTTNELGKALQQYASQNMSTIVDTSTAAGKLLAEQLGDGNYVDSKATLQGQLEILQSQFVDPTTGEPKIPSWAAATARNVSKIAAFSGMTGTAATAAMSQALLEASLPIAQSDSSFFQTLTVKNLDNKQQSTINAATVLAKFEQTNLDNRMTAAVQNSQAFLQMDMKNLDNKQQAAVINNQSMIQSILADANAENVKNQFLATSKNQTDQFYASLNTQIGQFNASQTLTADQFNSNLEDSRQKFYSEQQYNIAVANANWRNQVQLQDDQQKFEAATADVKSAVDLSVNQLNQIWDRSDSLLDYAWQTQEKAKDREASIAVAKLQASQASKTAIGGAIGSVVGSFVGSDSFSDMMSGLF